MAKTAYGLAALLMLTAVAGHRIHRGEVGAHGGDDTATGLTGTKDRMPQAGWLRTGRRNGPPRRLVLHGL